MNQDNIAEIVGRARAVADANGGLKAVYYVGCGGSLASSYIGYTFVKDENRSGLVVNHINSNEFVCATPKSVNANAIVIVTSMKATAESVEALNVARAGGAYTIAITGGPDTLMAKTANDFVIYTHSQNWTCAFHSVAVSLRLGAEILHQTEDYPHYQALVEAINSTNDRFEALRKENIPTGIRFALDFKDDELFHVFSSGSMYGVGYGEAYCHLAEMQHRNAIPINSAEYFHGVFETTVPNQASILFMNLGRYRPIDERIRRFLEQFCSHLLVIDAADLGLEDVNKAVVEYITPLLIGPLFRSYVDRMAEERDHPMEKRRYMWKFDY